jgi:hypothetical protein
MKWGGGGRGERGRSRGGLGGLVVVVQKDTGTNQDPDLRQNGTARESLFFKIAYK